jgi:phage shock protein B
MDSLIPILIFSTPIVWIVMHYRYSGARTSGFTEAESRQLRELLDVADRMGERIKTLESILDAETPDWREQHEKQ